MVKLLFLLSDYERPAQIRTVHDYGEESLTIVLASSKGNPHLGVVFPQFAGDVPVFAVERDVVLSGRP